MKRDLDNLPSVPGAPLLKQTHPEHSYFEPMTGILRHGRPIRSNFYVYKLSRADGEKLEAMIAEKGWLADGLRMPPEVICGFLDRHKVPWSHSLDRDGFEDNPTGRRHF